jgi:hypothetical protein
MTADASPAFPVLESIRWVVERSRRVAFHPERLQAAVADWGQDLDKESSWRHPCHYFDGTAETVRWIFVLDVLNHCFWPDAGVPLWSVFHDGTCYSGYWGLAAGLKRAMDRNIPVTDSAWLANVSAGALQEVFSGTGEIPLFAERLHNLREAGRMLQVRWRGDVLHLLKAARGSALRTVWLVVTSFPSFRDQARYDGRTIFFWKRAQIFAADLHNAFSGTGWGHFHDIDRLTAFADYKLPQVLRELGVISYRPDLAEKIDCGLALDPGGEDEIEIRAMTVRAVEKFREAFGAAGKTVTSLQIDNWLWQLGQKDRFRGKPYHRCRTIFY